MTMYYDINAKKKATNLSINSDLLQKAKSMNINLSQCLEQSLEAKVREMKIENWEKKNKEAIEKYNLDAENNGTFSDGLRSF